MAEMSEIKLRAMQLAVQAGTAGEPPALLVERAEEIEAFLEGWPPDEINVTEEMYWAGLGELVGAASWHEYADEEEALARAFRAMVMAQPRYQK